MSPEHEKGLVMVRSKYRLLARGILVEGLAGNLLRTLRAAWLRLAVAIVSLALVGCVTPAPQGEVVKLSVAQVQDGAELGVPLRWGGTIASVVNKAETTVVEVVSRPLQRSGRPLHNDKTDGRFLAELQGFVDPEILSPGRDISLVGTVNRIESGQVGEADYQYPYMTVFDYRVWKTLSEIDPNSGYPNYFIHDRYWLDWPHRRRRGLSGQIIF